MRAVNGGSIDRFGTIDTTDGGDSYRYSGSFEWQRTRRNASTKVMAFGIGYDLNLFSNFTYLPGRPRERGPVPSGQTSASSLAPSSVIDVWGAGRIARCRTRWAFNCGTTTSATWGCITRSRADRSKPFGKTRVLQTSVAGYVQNETEWTPWLRTLAGVRVDGYRLRRRRRASRPTRAPNTPGWSAPRAARCSDHGNGTELYLNAGLGFHSNDARGATITVDPQTGDVAQRVTPLARAKGAEVGMRTRRVFLACRRACRSGP